MLSVREKTATVQLKVRMRETLRAQLERAAEEADDSLNAEAVDRLERSFSQESWFTSREMQIWAVHQASRFSDSGRQKAAALGHPKWSDKDWMADPDCLTAATFEVIENLLFALARHPGCKPQDVEPYIAELPAHWINHAAAAGKVKINAKFDEEKP